ncbi:MAG: T9SS type B sorting domain-containing protein [Bacteroidia bacterium]
MKKVLVIWGLLYCVLAGSLQGQTPVMRTFAETGGSVSTGAQGSIATLSNGDVIVINERWTNFSQKGIQCFRLENGSLKILQSKAYFNDFTIQVPSILVKNDSIYVLAQHINGGIYKMLYLVFDQNLNLVRSVIHDSPESLLIYSFLADPDGSFRVYGAIKDDSRRFVMSLSSDGAILWSKRFGDNIIYWGGSVMLPNGSIIASAGGKFVSLNRSGGLLWVKNFGDEFIYAINGGSVDGNAIITRSAYDSSLIYSLKIAGNGQRLGQTQGVWMNRPVFSAVLPNKHNVVGSSSFAGERVFLKISEWDENGILVNNHRIDNIFKYAPTGALYDACKYSTHVDGAGNFYVLGVANRQGFFVLRLNQDLAFDCAYKEQNAEGSPVPENDPGGELVVDLPIAFIPYSFTAETPGNYEQLCTGCGSKIQEVLFDTSLCMLKPELTLNAGNPGAKYLWSDESSGVQIKIRQSGEYWVRISNDCDTLYDTVKVILHQKPTIQLQAEPEVAIPGEEILLKGLPDTFSTMGWYFADTLRASGSQSIWKADKNGAYTWYWEVYNDSTCRTRDSIVLRVSLIDYYFPNAFSPNNNGLNEGWGPVGTGIKEYKIEIYTRWGQLVFRGENQHWDGKYKGVGVMDGQYIYRVELINDDGVRKEYKGVITLVN